MTEPASPDPHALRQELGRVSQLGFAEAIQGHLPVLRGLGVVSERAISRKREDRDAALFHVLDQAIQHYLGGTAFGKAAYPCLGIGSEWNRVGKTKRDHALAEAVGKSYRTVIKSGNKRDQVLSAIADAVIRYALASPRRASAHPSGDGNPTDARWLRSETQLRWVERDDRVTYWLRCRGRGVVDRPSLRFFERSYKWTGIGKERAPVIRGQGQELYGDVKPDDVWRLFVIDLGRTYNRGEVFEMDWEVECEELGSKMSPWLEHRIRAPTKELVLTVQPPKGFDPASAMRKIVDPRTDNPVDDPIVAHWLGDRWTERFEGPAAGFKYRIEWAWRRM